MVVFNRTMLYVPNAAEERSSAVDDPLVGEISELGMRVSDPDAKISSSVLRLKRLFDIVFGLMALICLLPVLAIASMLIKLESRGPVFFVQERIGLDRRRRERRADSAGSARERRASDRRKNINAGKPFNIYKLRTMRQDAEVSGPCLAQKNDPRITRVGNFMRKTRVDEIPQFINVIKGEMSIIGPRPERSFFINQIKQEVPEFPLRQRVKPGITGLAQVEDGYTQNLDMMKRKLFYDLKYIYQFSLIHEIRILVKTVMVVITGKGAC